jgi:hypothetical protein
LGLLPLAVLGRLPDDRSAEESIRDIVQQIETRLVAELPRERAVILMRATVILASTRLEKNNLSRILQGVGLMGEVAASDYFTEQGEIKGRKEVLFELGRLKFGDTDETIEAALKSIADLDRLKRMGKAILTTNSWEELLSTP